MKIDEMITKRMHQKRAVEEANKIAKDEKKLLDEIDSEIIAALEAIGLESGSNDSYTAAITEEDVPDSTEWDTFYPFLQETGNFHLLQKRISSVAWREYKQIYGEYPPGTSATQRKSLSFTKRQTRRKK